MAARAMTYGGGRRRRFNAFAWLVVCAVAFLGFLQLIQNQGHANTKHAEAPAIRQAYKDGTCEGTELYYSASRGTVLVLCAIPKTRQWGGIIFKVTEFRDGAPKWLGRDAYEFTCFAANRGYWKRVIKRDGYVMLAAQPNVKRMFDEWIDGEL